ncbi:DUF2304 domain-containing protein [Faecalicoccus pleomorphus]|uniref:DUF2304 domain-containing protein n=1 Tax=Faecalicoccus pleomorphus TaxID=1323 RepID=A0AAW6CQU8_9FIRM|nr:DUF2304 domain-containing protein [Faecalicoccus pleomorphus]MDB7979971.1 DUF2304 domain-containing protein [Faecalicoccus pleomorphus]MDB7982243.1 DUF2304 domain-containing protein [Faecalicoccus pleomorphus]
MKLSVVFIVASLLTFIFVILKIRKNGLNIDDSIIWIIWSILLLVLSFFPGIAYFFSEKLGFMATSNFIFTIFIFFVYILIFIQAIQISKLKEKQKELIQKLSIHESQNREDKK